MTKQYLGDKYRQERPRGCKNFHDSDVYDTTNTKIGFCRTDITQWGSELVSIFDIDIELIK